MGDCAVMIKSAPCGTTSWGTAVNDVCKKTCGLCGGAPTPAPPKRMVCEDILAQTPSPITDCAVMIKSAPCGTTSWGTEINDVCKKTCGLCGGDKDGDGDMGGDMGIGMG